MSQVNGESFWNKVTPKVVATLIAAAVIGAVAHWWTPIILAFENGWIWFTEPVVISRFWFVFSVLCSLPVLFVLGALLFGQFFVSHSSPHHEYCQDNFDNLLWKWNWSSGYPSNLTAYCPDCKRIMLVIEDRMYAKGPSLKIECQSCRQPVILEGNPIAIEKSIRIEIQLRVDTGEWKEIVERNKSAAPRLPLQITTPNDADGESAAGKSRMR